MIYMCACFDLFVWLKDFAMRSLKIAEGNNTKADVVEQYQVKKDREWDERYNNIICNFVLKTFFYDNYICT